MSGILEEYWSEREKEVSKTSARRMLAAGKWTLEDVAYCSGLSLEEVKKLQSDKSA